MKRTSLCIDEDSFKKLKEMSYISEKSMSFLVRKMIEKNYEKFLEKQKKLQDFSKEENN